MLDSTQEWPDPLFTLRKILEIVEPESVRQRRALWEDGRVLQAEREATIDAMWRSQFTGAA